MDTPYRLKIKVGPHEFEAEGSPKNVREQFQAFKEMIAIIPAPTPPNPQTTPAQDQNRTETPADKSDVPPTELPLSKIMKAEGRTVSLTIRPKTLEDGILLILLGHKVLRQSDSVTGGEIIDGLKTTGGVSFDRIDRTMEKIGKNGDIILTGENRGKRYRMTNAGVAKARQIAADLLAVALDGPNQEGTAHFDGSPVPSSGVAGPPVLEMADRRDLQSCDRTGRPGPNPGWGTKVSPT